MMSELIEHMIEPDCVITVHVDWETDVWDKTNDKEINGKFYDGANFIKKTFDLP